jgi:hypothetical protein
MLLIFLTAVYMPWWLWPLLIGGALIAVILPFGG